MGGYFGNLSFSGNFKGPFGGDSSSGAETLPFFSLQPQDQDVIEGQTGMFTAEIEHPVSSTEIFWRVEERIDGIGAWMPTGDAGSGTYTGTPIAVAWTSDAAVLGQFVEFRVRARAYDNDNDSQVYSDVATMTTIMAFGTFDEPVEEVETTAIPQQWESRQELKAYAQDTFGVSLDARRTIPNMLTELETAIT